MYILSVFEKVYLYSQGVVCGIYIRLETQEYGLAEVYFEHILRFGGFGYICISDMVENREISMKYTKNILRI